MQHGGCAAAPAPRAAAVGLRPRRAVSLSRTHLWIVSAERGHPLSNPSVATAWRLAVGGVWQRLVVRVGGGWRFAAVGGWRLVVFGSGWWSVLVAVDGLQRLAVGGWRLVVPGGCP